MAIFNPDVPDVQASYLNLSRPIQQPDFKSAVGGALKDIGEITASGIKGADTVVKSFIENETRDALEKERDEYSAALETGKKVTYASLQSPVNMAAKTNTNVQGADQTPQSLLPTPAAELPQDLRNLPNTLGALDGARANGKLSETDFLARTSMILKDIRSRWPEGYREYIDDVSHKTLGFIPANKYITSVLGDINAALTNANAERNHMRTRLDHAIDNGVENANIVKQMWQTGRYRPDQVDTFLNKSNAYKSQDALIDSRLKLETAEARDFEKAYTDRGGRIATNYFNLLKDAIPSGVEKDENGNLVFKPEQAQLFNQTIQQKKQEAILRLKELRDIDYNGRTINSMVGQKKLNELDGEILGYFDFFSKRMIDKDSGVAFLPAHLIETIKSHDQLDILRDKTGTGLGPIVRQLNALDTLGGSNASKEFLKNEEEKRLPEAMRAYSIKRSLDIKTSDPLNPTTPAEVMNEARRIGVTLPKVYDGILDLIDQLTDPSKKEEEKLPIAAAFSHIRNRSLLDNVAPDSVDPKTSRVIPGKGTAYRKLTSDAVARQYAELGKKNPWLLDQYRDQVTTMNHQLFSGAIKDLGGFVQTMPKGLEVTWDNETHRLAVSYNGDPQFNLRENVVNHKGPLNEGIPLIRQPGVPFTDPGAILTARAVNRVNQGIRGVANMANASGQDTNVFVIRLLQSEGVDVRNIKGLPRMILDAIETSAKKQDRINKLKAE